MTGLKLQLLRYGFSLLFGAAGLHMARVARRVFMRQREWKEKGIVTQGEIVDFQSESPTNEPARRDLKVISALLTTVRIRAKIRHARYGL